MSSRAKRDRTARLVKTANLLHQYRQGLNPRRLAELCQVSVRTVYRDLRALEEELRYPIWQGDRRYGLEEGFFLPPLSFTMLEAMALFLAARLVSRYSDERDHNIVTAFEKLATVLPAPVAQHVSETVRAMLSRRENPDYARVFGNLAMAWARNRRVRIHYPRTEDGITTVYRRLVEPYFLEPSPISHSCYLIGYCHHAKSIRTFKVERIREAEVTDEAYEIPTEFDLNDYLRASWGVVADEDVEVQLCFSPTVASRVQECTWHPSQSVAVRGDGSLDFTVTVAGTLEITPWILSWGAEVEVLAPPELRSRLAEVAHRMARSYGVDPMARPPNG